MSLDRPVSILLGRFRQMPPVSRETWQGALVRLPSWIEEGGPDQKPWRPWAAVWVSLTSGRMTFKLQDEGQDRPDFRDLVLRGLFQFADQERKVVDGRARGLQVADASLAEFLREALKECDVTVDVVPRADAVAHALHAYQEEVFEGPLPPGALEGEGMTLDVLRDYADGAAAFYRAAPWEHLGGEDLIEIEAPVAPAGYRFATVLGAGDITVGIGFHRSRDSYALLLEGDTAGLEREPASSVLFQAADGIPFDDHDLWLDHDLPLADADAYPFAAMYQPPETITRPSAHDVIFMEAILRTLSETTEEEMDAGRWTREVCAGGRTTTVTLALPDLLEAQSARRPPTGSTPLERAQELANAASELIGRRAIVLAKEALALSPDCADAHVILGEHTARPDQALGHYERAVAAARRTIGSRFDDLRGSFGEHAITASYLQAELALADTLAVLDRFPEAIDHYQQMLALDPSDQQGAREPLAALLLEAGRDAEAGTLFGKFRGEASSTMAWAEVLWAFRQFGDGPTTREALKKAAALNRFVAEYLSNDELFREDVDEGGVPDQVEAGSRGEALVTVAELQVAWKATPAALSWLAQRRAGGASTKARRKRPKR